MAKLLLVDDDTEVLEINQKYLTAEGYTVYVSSDSLKSIEIAKRYHPDCILLDIMMPGMDGYRLCSELRKFTTAPIIFLTGKSSEDDKVNGLLTGADDYIVKPYSLRELKARVDVILRRVSRTPAHTTDTGRLTFHNLIIDRLEHKVFYKTEDLMLSNREYEVLLYLALHPNQEISFEELGTALFGSYQESDRRSVMVNVSRLRKKMAVDFELENMIETVWSKGYKFIAK